MASGTSAAPAGPDPAAGAGTPAERPAQERHVPILLERCTEVLAPSLAHEGAVSVDATLGMGGHAEALLDRFPRLRLVGVDRDPQALALAGTRLARFGERVTLVHAVSDDLPDVLDDLGLDVVDAVFFDLGVSSLQLDEVDRGFSYARDAPLDMRMDQTRGITAADVLNTYSHGDLARILKNYGEERFAGRIASAIVREREREEFRSSARLVELVRANVPAATRRTGGNPAKRTFQALRIEVNDELAVVQRSLRSAFSRLAPSGRLAVLTFHSLEDRIAKTVLRELSTSSAPPDLPVVPVDALPPGELLLRGGVTADDVELAENPRAASARLRAVLRRPLDDFEGRNGSPGSLRDPRGPSRDRGRRRTVTDGPGRPDDPHRTRNDRDRRTGGTDGRTQG
ncbi:16S rRNA (cytosine(1402)-N(4))-methyltransferase RsmH [Kineococcus gynurae]|uniref:Ribosomal RNA small subunit methyltransferase H n=1 Tax=Kineococcus gynurae TaxID=452979 RepID=A0ABV5LXR3_9ACTN